MFQKNSFSIPSENSGLLLTKVIQIRRCSTRRQAKVGKFLRVTIRATLPHLIKRKKKKYRAITVRTKHYHKRNDGLVYQFADNALVLLKKRMNTVSKDILGPSSLALKIKKFRIGFKGIF